MERKCTKRKQTDRQIDRQTNLLLKAVTVQCERNRGCSLQQRKEREKKLTQTRKKRMVKRKWRRKKIRKKNRRKMKKRMKQTERKEQ